MPTPFYHLSLAEELLAHPDLPPAAAHLLRAERPAFLFGNTAPDVQVVSGQRRELTHFFQVPPLNDTLPTERLLNEFPSLAAAGLAPAQAAFMAGYLFHLLADYRWVTTVFLPVFGVEAGWGTFPHRLYIHNIVRTWLDEEVLAALPPDTGKCLATAQPARWLPFVEDIFLHEWRDYVADQLQPGAQSETVIVFAGRQGLDPQEFFNLLRSPERMQTEVFTHLAPQDLIEYRQALTAESLTLIADYLATETSTP